jgi:hypothetical protein
MVMQNGRINVQIRSMIIYWRCVLERSLSNVCNIPSRRVTQIKGAMTLRCFWNCQGVDRRKPEKFHEDPKVVQSSGRSFEAAWN